MKRAARIAAAALLGLALVAAALWWTGPHPPLPGGPLRGPEAALPPDWSALDGSQFVEVESRASWLPYSTGAMIQVHRGDLYLIFPSLFGDAMHRRLERDPQLRLRHAERVYRARAEFVEDPHVITEMIPAFLWKFFALDVQGAVSRSSRTTRWSGAEVWVYRVAAAKRTRS